MIKSWKHKGLKDFFETGNTRGIQSKHTKKLRVQLGFLDTAEKPSDMDLPGYNFHALVGNMKGIYAIKVSANWRITFSFENSNAVLVNYEDYH